MLWRQLFTFALGLCVTTSVARAEDEPVSSSADEKPSEADQAKALFKEGRKLAADGHYESACPKFERSLKLDDGVGTRFNLADCWEHIGRTASARALFLEVAESAKEANQPEREAVARARVEELESKLSKLMIDVDAPDPKIEVRRDGALVEKDDWGSAIAVDPGTYELKAKASGKKPWSSRVKVPASPILVAVTVPKLEAEGPKKGALAVKKQPAAAKEPEPKPAKPADDNAGPNNVRAASYIIGGVGVASLIAGTTFAIQYNTSNNDARAVCRTSVNCTHQEVVLHQSLVDDSKKALTLAYVGFGVGSVAVIGAAILFAASGGGESQHVEHPPNATLRALPQVAADGSYGAALYGSF